MGRQFCGCTYTVCMPNRNPVELLSYVLAEAERDKAEIARRLHDELGALLVAAVMDVAWSEQHLPQLTDPGRQRLQRIHGTLKAAIDLKRKLIEDLRPTLLDNMGLYAALGWQLKAVCAEANILCSGEFPTTELQLSADMSIAIFRIAQDALMLMTLHRGVTCANLRAEVDGSLVTLSLTDDGTLDVGGELSVKGTQAQAYLTHRVRALGGDVEVLTTPKGTTLRAVISTRREGLDPPTKRAQG